MVAPDGALSRATRDTAFAWSILRKRPFALFLQVTNRCNMKCGFCDFWAHGVPAEQELSLDDYRFLEQELSRLGRFVISIEGGEPFIRPDLVEIVRIFSQRHITALYTNGWFVTPTISRDLFAAGLSQVGVSIDYPDALRHDANRRLPGGWERAWEAVRLFAEAAPHGPSQAHVMTVLMDDNTSDFEELLRMSEPYGVAHQMTLLSSDGFRRAPDKDLPQSGGVGEELIRLWHRYPHFKSFQDYLDLVDPFLTGGDMPECRAGVQSFNIDHIGNVSPCIEKIDVSYGNVRDEPLARIHARMAADGSEVKGCQDCLTLCRSWSQVMGQRGSVRGWRDMMMRMRVG